MKHQVCAFLLLVSFSACADFDTQIIADKSKRVGRFSYEDSFDESLVETVLNNSSAVVKKNVRKLLYPDEDDVKQRLLLLGGISNASTTAIAKAIAVRCGYEYYLVEASALLKECREGRQMLLSEIRPIIKQGKPIAIIITELPEMADYSGLLASTLWLLIDQCAQYPDVFVIGTSALQKGQLSEEIKERFGGDIISVSLDKSMQDNIENVVVPKTSWLERNKTACLVAGGLVGLALVAAHLYAQILFAATQAQQQKEDDKILLEQKIVALSNEMRIQSDIVTQVQQQEEDEKILLEQKIIALSDEIGKQSQLLSTTTQTQQQKEGENKLLKEKIAVFSNDITIQNQLIQKQQYDIQSQKQQAKCEEERLEDLKQFKQKKLQEEQARIDLQNTLLAAGGFVIKAAFHLPRDVF